MTGQTMTGQSPSSRPMKMRAVPGARLARLPQVQRMDPAVRRDIEVVSSVLPFKVNNYVLDELIDWDRAPDDPIYRLTFPDRDMLPEPLYEEVAELIDGKVPRAELLGAVNRARLQLNPHPGGSCRRTFPRTRRARSSVCSTSTERRCWCSPDRARPATPTADTASAGPSSSASRN
ncbi:hypothetical protein ACFQ0X_00080 [Streptomyces rectiviolaceus]|uniref:hypothetical protein n=1 Tax=Streptomyces rectiviolaceus TaxID=332591 RepID=UPI00363F118F